MQPLFLVRVPDCIKSQLGIPINQKATIIDTATIKTSHSDLVDYLLAGRIPSIGVQIIIGKELKCNAS